MKKELPSKTIQFSAASPAGYYDATSQTGETDFGSYPTGHEDWHFSGAYRSLALSRFRREVRNNPFLAALWESYPILVGTAGFRSRTQDAGYNAAAEAFWRKWEKALTPTGDSLSVVQALRLREDLLAGEQFYYLQRNGQVVVIPSEACGSPNDALTPSPFQVTELHEREQNGIIYNADGSPRAYRFGRLTSWGGYDYSGGVVIPAQYILHDFGRDRVLQGRGLPRLLPSLKPARDLYEVCRAKTKQIKDANVISGVIETDRSGSESFRGLSGPVVGGDGEPVAEGGDAPADADDVDPIRIELKSGTFISLLPGEKLNALKTEYNASDYKELVMLMLHMIAAPVGLPVEFWFSGLGEINFSGFKGLGAQWNARRQWIKEQSRERFLDPLREWRVALAHATRQLPEPVVAELPCDYQWRWRKTAVLDEEREANANKKKYESGEAILSDTWEENGEYPEEVFARRRQTYVKMMIAAGELPVDADPEAVKVPMIFLWRGKLPEELPQPATPKQPSTEDDDASTREDN